MEYLTIIRYIKGEASPPESAEVNKWRSVPENEAKYKDILRIWETSKKVSQPYFFADTKKAWQKVNQSISEKRQNNPVLKFKNHYTKLAFAASFLLLCTIGWFLFQTSNTNYNTEQDQWITINSAGKEKKEITLPDGTKVWLNKNSTLQYPETFKDNTREVIMNGEAFFEVTRNKEKPFRVFTLHSVTEVLGTSFHINALEQTSSTEINVITGKVAFSDSKYEKRKIILIKGEKGILTSDNNLIKDKVNENMNFLAWKTGNLKFSGTTLDQVCKTLSDYYGRNIQLGDSSMNEIGLTASFSEQSLEDVLDIINLTLDTEYIINDTSILLIN